MSRRLRPDERELWTTVARSVAPIRAERMEAWLAEQARPAVEPAATPASDAASPPPVPAPPASKPALPRPVPADLTRHDQRRIERGRTEIEGRLDLHGMRQDEAFSRLQRFLVQSRSKGRRHVLVITGTGRAGRDGGGADREIEGSLADILSERASERGVLYRMVPHWLNTAPLRAHVTAVSPASRRHGGDGALYVRLAK